MNETSKTLFGHMPNGIPVEEVFLTDGSISCGIITYGGALRSLTVPDRDGRPVDVALGFDTLEDYLTQDKYIGAGTPTALAEAGSLWKGRSTRCGPMMTPTISTAGRKASINKSGRSARIPAAR